MCAPLQTLYLLARLKNLRVSTENGFRKTMPRGDPLFGEGGGGGGGVEGVRYLVCQWMCVVLVFRTEIDQPGVIKSLGNSLCSVVPSTLFISASSRGGQIEFVDHSEELQNYVHYAYSRYYLMEEMHGLTKRHLNYGLFA